MNHSYSFYLRTKLIFSLLIGASGWGSGWALAADNTQVAIRRDPALVVGADSCAKCHENEVAQWKQTPHYANFETLHRKPEAKAIAKRLGFSSIKRNDTCVRCHYTQKQENSRTRVKSGVSCESCHGAAKNWIEIHNDYGGPQATKQSETPEHRAMRLKQSIAAGMNNPHNLYLIARQCLSCHTTPNEKLVNVGGHPAGSQDFELVAWSQGMVRHNFLRTGGSSNARETQERLRVMYIVGVLADLEASFKATAKATHKAPFGIASAQRAARLKHKLYEISMLIDDPHLQQALDAALVVPLKLSREQELEAAANSIGKAAHAFAVEADGSKLAAIDPMLPPPSAYKR